MNARYLILFFLSFLFLNTYAMQPQVQERVDTVRCQQNLSVYTMNLKKGMYDLSVDSWRDVFRHCPDMHVNIYSDGVKMMEHFLKKTTDEGIKQAYVDTILMIYDQRIVHFGKHRRYPEGWIQGRKGLDIFKYRGMDPHWQQISYDCFTKSHQLQGDQMEPSVMFAWMQVGRNLFQSGAIEGQTFLDLFYRVNGYSRRQLLVETDSTKIQMYQQLSDYSVRLALESLKNRCEVVEGFLKGSQEVSSMTPGQLEHTVSLMDGLLCTGSDYYVALLEKMYEGKPDNGLALKVARTSVRNNDYQKARHYYQKSLEGNGDNEVVATASYEWAVVEMSHFKDLSKALALARKSVQMKPAWGKPYLLIGNIYAQAANEFGKDEFEKQSVYWAAVDKFQAAIQADATMAEEAAKYVETYSKYFPDREMAFFHGYQDGEVIEIGSWINESTKVRFR
jgi:tetratricopeptide (TPR) repeat protein